MTTIDKIDFPPTAALAPLLRDLLGVDVSLTPVEPSPEANDAAVLPYLTVFVGDDDEPVMMAAGDLAFVAFAGCALALIPKGRADDLISSGSIDDEVDEFYREVMNVVTRAVNENSSKHVRLVPGMRPAIGDVPAAHAALTFDTELARYGSSRLTFWLV